MHTLLTILIGLAIAGWFLYCLYRMLRGARQGLRQLSPRRRLRLQKHRACQAR